MSKKGRTFLVLLSVLSSASVLAMTSAQLFSPINEITTSIEVTYAYEDILSLELHVSDVSRSPLEYLWNQSTKVAYSESPTRTANYPGIDMHTWEKSFDKESSGSIKVEYAVVSRRSSFQGSRDATIDDSPSWASDRFLKNESIRDSRNNIIKLIDLNDEIKNLSKNITRGERRTYYASQLIYQWVVDNIRYRVDDDPYPKGTMRTLKDREGDCDDMSALFCSLARSVGIPCYLVDGYVIERAGALPYAHTWAGVIVGGGRGIFDSLPVDPAFREFGTKAATKIAVGFDPGNDEYLQKAYRAFRFTYENSDGTNGGAAIVAVARMYADDRDPLYEIKKRSSF